MNPRGAVVLNRLPPAMPPDRYQTFSMLSPLPTHWVFGTCEQYECNEYLYGFHLDIDEATELGQRQAHYLRHDKSRTHTEERLDNGLTRFEYPAGQRGFGEGHKHKMRSGRPSRLIQTGGDWRGNPRGDFREFTRREDWVDAFANHQISLKEAIERG